MGWRRGSSDLPSPGLSVPRPHSHCPGRRWPHPVGGFGGSWPGRGRWRSSASVPHSVGLPGLPPKSRNPGGRKQVMWQKSESCQNKSINPFVQQLFESQNFVTWGSSLMNVMKRVGRFRGPVRQGEWVGWICDTWGSSLMNVMKRYGGLRVLWGRVNGWVGSVLPGAVLWWMCEHWPL